MLLADLRRSRAIVTGASSGIGKAVCQALVEQGAEVFGLDVRPASFNVRSITCDLREPLAVSEAVAAVRKATPTVDFLVNVAGKDPKYSLAEGGDAAWDDVMNTNLRGAYLLIRECLPLLEAARAADASRYPSVVNISSINHRLGVPRRSIYTVSKAGTLGLTRGLSRELGAKGIRINTISPGWVMTEGQREQYFNHSVEGPKYREYLRSVQSMDRDVTPGDIANHVLFYLSNASGNVAVRASLNWLWWSA